MVIAIALGPILLSVSHWCLMTIKLPLPSQPERMKFCRVTEWNRTGKIKLK